MARGHFAMEISRRAAALAVLSLLALASMGPPAQALAPSALGEPPVSGTPAAPAPPVGRCPPARCASFQGPDRTDRGQGRSVPDMARPGAAPRAGRHGVRRPVREGSRPLPPGHVRHRGGGANGRVRRHPRRRLRYLLDPAGPRRLPGEAGPHGARARVRNEIGRVRQPRMPRRISGSAPRVRGPGCTTSRTPAAIAWASACRAGSGVRRRRERTAGSTPVFSATRIIPARSSRRVPAEPAATQGSAPRSRVRTRRSLRWSTTTSRVRHYLN